MKHLLSYLSVLSLAACGNPGGISDSEYANYKELAAPKILYSCTGGDETFESKRHSSAGEIGSLIASRIIWRLAKLMSVTKLASGPP